MTTQTAVYKHPLVLVVDDDPMTQASAEMALQAAGFSVVQALDGPAALEAFAGAKPDLVLMDVVMPGMDGYATCAAMRRLPAAQHTPIVFLTGCDDTDSIHAAYEAGATDFVSKPFNGVLLGHRARYLLRASTALHEINRSREHLATAQQLAKVGSWEWDIANQRLSLSEVACHIFGLSSPAYRGTLQSFLEHVSPSVGTTVSQILSLPGIATHPYHQDHKLTLQSGAQRDVHIQARAVLAPATGKITTITATVQDITERKRLEDHVHNLAYYDSLTGLPNRMLFRDRVHQALAHASRQRTLAAILFVDIDRFKFINDTFGHTAGDHLLKQIAERLTDVTRTSDSVARQSNDEVGNAVARLGGDEFTILLTQLKQPDNVTVVARRILASLATPFTLEGREVFVTGSIGIALAPADGETLEELLKNADTAMYQAKGEGRNNYQYYSRSMNAMAVERMNLENEIRHAFQRDEFRVVYQPFVDAANGQVVGAEALVRWQHPTRGLLAPGAFLNVVDEIGLSRRLDLWVMETACRQMVAWRKDCPRPLRIAVNLSNAQFQDPALFTELVRVLTDSGLPAELVELELTENIVMPNPEEAARLLKRLKELGLRLALDDFGTGTSSISHLRTLPFDTIKIDRSFIADVAGNPDDAAIAEAMIVMAHIRKMHVLAEGIETQEQLRLLQTLRCDEFQGYLFSKPVLPDAIAALLNRSLLP
ncbi:MAG: EAL domain-containing protein [Nitrospiraceae bacterium]